METLRIIAAAIALAALGGKVASATVVLSDDFNYANGSLVGAAGSPWATHSGTAGQVDVASNQVNLTQAESEDVNSALSGAPISTGTLYAGLDFNLSTLPTGAGNYFAHFKDTGTSNFRGRVFVTTTGAAAGTFRVGIADTTTNFVTIPIDLSLNTTHRFVVANNTTTGRSTLYLDSLTETGGTVATDTTSALAISTYAFRQSTATVNTVSSSGMGVMTVDNLRVGTTYAEALVPEPASLGLITIGAVGLLARRRRNA